MADPEKPPRKPPKRRRAQKRGDDHGDDVRGGPHEEEGHAVEVHEAYLAHRFAGGETPDPEARLRAIEQFERLPGALPTMPPAPADDTGGPEDDSVEEGPTR
jgi:hypothetical protein